MADSDVATATQAGVPADGAAQQPARHQRRAERIFGITDDVLLQFSRPAARVTGPLVSLFGLALIVTVLVLATIHMLGSEDFVAATIAGALLAIAGIFTLITDYVGAQHEAIVESARLGVEELKRRNAALAGFFAPPIGGTMGVFRRVRLPVLAHVLFAATFGVLLYFGIVGGPTYGPAVLGIAGAWVIGIFAIEYPLASDAYRRRAARKAQLKAGYSSVLALADSYAEAWDSHVEAATAVESATSDKDTAQKRLGLHYNPDNKRAFDDANKKLKLAAQSFLTARQTSEKRCEEYSGARDSVKSLASLRVQSALADFDESLTRETTARDKARLGFVNAVRADLHQPRWPDPGS